MRVFKILEIRTTMAVTASVSALGKSACGTSQTGRGEVSISHSSPARGGPEAEKRQIRSFSDSVHSEAMADRETEPSLGRSLLSENNRATDTAQAFTKLTSAAMLKSQSALEQALQTHIEATRGDYLEHYLQQGHTYRTALRCARTCAFVTFLCEQEYLIEVQSTDAKAASLHTQALHANVIQVLSKLDISVPQSAYRYHEWWSNMKQKVAPDSATKDTSMLREALGIHLQEAVPQAVLPKRQHNTNTCKLHAEAQRYIDYLYSQGNALPVRQIYEKLLTHAREQDWWHSQSVFNPPSYRTVALYVSTRQADLVLARQGESAHYTRYLPQIQRSLPTEKNALWGADGTAHNELVFHNGRTRQAVYGIYIFDYASAKLLACAPYLVRRGASERAIYYIEALSSAIQKTQCVPQVLQIDRGPAYTEVKKVVRAQRHQSHSCRSKECTHEACGEPARQIAKPRGASQRRMVWTEYDGSWAQQSSFAGAPQSPCADRPDR